MGWQLEQVGARIRVCALFRACRGGAARQRSSASHLLNPHPSLSLSQVGIPDVLSFGLSPSTQAPSNWRSRLEDALEQLAESDTGLLIVIDEVDPSLDEMIQAAAIYRQFVIDKRKVSLVMAGLPFFREYLLERLEDEGIW